MQSALMNGPLKTKKVTSATRLGFHFGNVLQVLADRYPKLQNMILEQVQNALDADATKITIKVDLSSREFEIWDNGNGATSEDMEDSFAELGQTRKKDDKFGRFGIGVVSAYGKCEYFTFTSCAKDHEGEGFRTWIFNTKKIMRESSSIDIPCETQPRLLYWPDENVVPQVKFRSMDRVPWRTRVKVVGLRRDARLCQINLNTLKAEMVSRYGKKMLKLGTVVKIRYTDEKGRTEKVMDVAAESYTGKSLPVHKANNPDVGNVFLRLYLARNIAGKRTGAVNISIFGNPFRIDAKTCFSGLVGGIIEKDVYDDLVSGVFEGDIECEKLSLKTERDGFVDNDALAGLCLAISDWHREIGLKHVLEAQNTKQESMYQQTGLKAMQYIESLCRLDLYKDLVSYLKIGTIGKGHKDGPTFGENLDKSLSADGGSGEKREEGPGTTIRGITKKRLGGEHKDHIPGTVVGPRGSIRRQVKGHSVGLRFQYAQLTADQVYEFDIRTGVLTFNYSHEYWQICEINKTALARYQATIAEMVLVLLPYVNGSQYDIQNEILLDFLQIEVHRIVDGDAFFTDRKIKRHTL